MNTQSPSEPNPLSFGAWLRPGLRRYLPRWVKDLFRWRFYGVPKQLLDRMREIDGWLSDSEAIALYRIAKACTAPTVAVEIGSWMGKSTVMIAGGIRDGGGGRLYAVDPFEGDDGSPEGKAMPERHESFVNGFQSNIQGAHLDNYVVPLVGYSHEIASHWLKPINLVFIDGDHDYESVKRDFDQWARFVSLGGYAVFHDTDHPGPARVIRENLTPHWQVLGRIDHLTLVRKVII